MQRSVILGDNHIEMIEVVMCGSISWGIPMVWADPNIPSQREICSHNTNSDVKFPQ